MYQINIPIIIYIYPPLLAGRGQVDLDSDGKIYLLQMEVTEMQKLGVGLGSFGVFFLLLGVLLLFDGGLLAIGNLFCLAG